MSVGVQKAYPFEEKRLLTWTKPWVIQPKLDGDRLRAVFDKEGKVTLLSSEANEKAMLPHIVSELEASGLKNIELDGEFYIHGLCHEEIHSIFSRSVNVHEGVNDGEFHVFDFIDERSEQFDRLKAMLICMRQIKGKHIIQVPFEGINEVEDVYRRYDDFINEGYEGFILRNVYATYVRRRSTMMMKFKPKKDDSYLIIGFREELSKDKVPKGRLGAFECISNDGSDEPFKVGSGLTEKQRIEYWPIREMFIGKWCHVKYQHLTATGKVPRHPVFIEVKEQAEENLNNYKVEI